MKRTLSSSAIATAICLLGVTLSVQAQPAGHSMHNAAASSGTATAAAQPAATKRYDLHTNIVDGKMVFVDDKGQVNPTLSANAARVQRYRDARWDRDAIEELLTDALRNPIDMKQALDAMGQAKQVGEGRIGDFVIHRSPDLTILRAAVPPKFKSPPHNHLMWAVIGVYEGQENNYFYRRGGEGLEPAGSRQLKPSDILVLGQDVIQRAPNDRYVHRGGVPPTQAAARGRPRSYVRVRVDAR